MARKGKTTRVGRAKYDDLRDAAVHAVITCASDTEAAAKLGIGERTLKRWKAKPEFQELLASKRNRIAEGADEAIARWFAKLWEYGPESLDVAAQSMRGACKVEFKTDADGNIETEVTGDHGARTAAARMIAGEFSKGMTYIQTENRLAFMKALAKHLGVDLRDLVESA